MNNLQCIVCKMKAANLKIGDKIKLTSLSDEATRYGIKLNKSYKIIGEEPCHSGGDVRGKFFRVDFGDRQLFCCASRFKKIGGK